MSPWLPCPHRPTLQSFSKGSSRRAGILRSALCVAPRAQLRARGFGDGLPGAAKHQALTGWLALFPIRGNAYWVASPALRRLPKCRLLKAGLAGLPDLSRLRDSCQLLRRSNSLWIRSWCVSIALNRNVLLRSPALQAGDLADIAIFSS